MFSSVLSVLSGFPILFYSFFTRLFFRAVVPSLVSLVCQSIISQSTGRSVFLRLCRVLVLGATSSGSRLVMHSCVIDV